MTAAPDAPDFAQKAQRLYLDLDEMTGVEGVEAITAALEAAHDAGRRSGVKACAKIVKITSHEDYMKKQLPGLAAYEDIVQIRRIAKRALAQRPGTEAPRHGHGD